MRNRLNKSGERWFRSQRYLANQRSVRKQDNNQFVRVYDFGTQTMTSIPAAELSSNMIAAKIEGVDGMVWIDASDLNADSELRHPPFDEQTRDIMRSILSRIEEVHPCSLEIFEHNLRKDINPDREIMIWANLAATYTTITQSLSLTLFQKKEYFNLLLRATMTPREHIYEVIKLRTITREEAEQAIDLLLIG